MLKIIKNKIELLISLCASVLCAAVFAGCVEDLSEQNAEGCEAGAGAKFYLAVNIADVSTVQSRAVEFNNGTPGESGASEGLFFIFSADGKSMYSVPQRRPLTSSPSGGAASVAHTVLLIDGVPPSEGPTPDMQVVCVLNAPKELEQGVASLQDLTSKTIALPSCEANTFIMTNAVYKEGSSTVTGTPITAANLARSRDEALRNPVIINVERLVAKVRVRFHPDFVNEGIDVMLGDTILTHYYINITGIAVVNSPDKAYLFKNIGGINQSWSWNDAARHRSYWESIPSDVTYPMKSYNDYVEASAGLDFEDLENFDYTTYVLPNTGSAKQTALLVCAQYFSYDSKMLIYFNGTYYDEWGIYGGYAYWLKKMGYVDVYYGTKGYDPPRLYEYPILRNHFSFYNNYDMPLPNSRSYECCAYFPPFKDGERHPYYSDLIYQGIYKKVKDSTGKETLVRVDDYTELNNLCKEKGKVQFYNEGKCYYFVNIDHSSIANLAPHTLEGVVRNTFYDLTIKSIGQLGTPVFDGTDPIDPERIETNPHFGIDFKCSPWNTALNKNINIEIK